MKKFFSLWVVSIVFATVAGLFVGLIEYLTSSIIEDGEYEWRCGVLFGCSRGLIEIVGFYPLGAFVMMLFAYPIFMAIVGSFKAIFSDK